MNNRLKQFLLRIADLVYLSIIAYTLIFLILQSETLSSLFFFLSESFNLLPKPIGFLILGCIGFSLPIFLKKHSCYNINHTIINDIRNPPIYLAPIFVILPSIFIHSELQELLHTSAIFAFTVGLFLCLCMMLMNNKKEENHTAKSKISFDMKTWLEHEIPINNKNYDFLGFYAYVERVTTLLKDNSKNKSHQIAIRGDFGTGKSSLCRLLEERLSSAESPKFIFCYVDGWGREDSSFAGQILEIVIEKLSEHTDCSSLIDVPESYMNALNGSGLNSLATVTQLFSPTQKSDPEKHLRKIDGLLASISSQMVITLEDFDRGPKPSKAINELGSLLERTKDLKNIHFLLCIKQEKTTIIDKICTHIEDIHAIPAYSSATLIKEFIAYIEKEHPSITTIEAINHHFIPEINPLIKNPRLLKQALRRTSTAWENLNGEIDFIDLLHFNILRFCSPEHLLFFINNFSTLSSLENAQITPELNNLKDELNNKINSLNNDPTVTYAAKIIIETFFSTNIFGAETFSNRQIILENYHRLTNSKTVAMQRIRNNGKTNYLARAITETLGKNEAKDTNIVCALKNEKPAEDLGKILVKTENEDSYRNHLDCIINWALSSALLDDKLCDQLTETLNTEFNKNIKDNTSLYFESGKTFHDTNKKNNTLIYIICKEIENVLKNKKDKTQKIKKLLLENIVHKNISCAIEIINHRNYNYTPETQKQLIKLLINTINEHNKSDIFSSMDKTDTQLIQLLFENHKTTGSRLDLESQLIEFHKFILQNNSIYKPEMIPAILFHFEDNKVAIYHSLREHWDLAKLKELIINFKVDEMIEYQHKDELIKLLENWKEYASTDFLSLKK